VAGAAELEEAHHPRLLERLPRRVEVRLRVVLQPAGAADRLQHLVEDLVGVDVDRIALLADVAAVVVLAGAIEAAVALRHVVPADAEDLAVRRDQHRTDLPSQRAGGE
jgi:hypothetical protein